VQRFVFWQRWLLGVGILTAIFGVVMAVLNGTPIFDLFNRQIDPVFWGAEPPSNSVAVFRQWVYGVWGATVAGLGVFVVFAAHYPFKRRETWARTCLIAGLAVWYILDTGISLQFQVYFNAAFNTLLLVAAALPIGFTWRAFSNKAKNTGV
jgi:hypothetical protein